MCLCDSVAKVRNIFADVEVSGNRIKHIILLKTDADELASIRTEAETRGIKIHTFDEIMVRFLTWAAFNPAQDSSIPVKAFTSRPDVLVLFPAGYERAPQRTNYPRGVP